MARKATSTVQDTPPEMDYAQHNATYEGFLAMVKWGIVATLLIVLSLYCFIEAQQPILGTLLLLVIPAGAVALAVLRWRNPA